MKITKYEQSCFVVEEGNTRILFDAGMYSLERPIEEYGELDAVIYTHLHHDHFDPDIFDKLLAKSIPAYMNQAHYEISGNRGNVVNNMDEIKINDLTIKAIELPHCLMFDGSEGPQNTGYLVNNKIFFPGDGKELEGLNVEVLACPISGPDISFKDAFSFSNQVGAKKVIPIHFDSLGAKPEVFKSFAERFKQNYSVEILGIGESLEI